MGKTRVRKKRTYAARRPSEPAVVNGEFVGRKLSDLSDEELSRFIRHDAKWQSKLCLQLPPLPPTYLDFAPYWFAKYEMERRKSAPEPSIELGAYDATEKIARKLFDFGYRAACLKYHPDRGGENGIMQRINIAAQVGRERLKA